MVDDRSNGQTALQVEFLEVSHELKKFMKTPVFMVSAAAIIIYARIISVDFDWFVVTYDGTPAIFLHSTRDTAMIVDVCVFWIDLNCLIEVYDRIAVISFLPIGDAAIIVSVGIFRVYPNY